MVKTTLKTFISGFLMGSADVVPGVSGGTIALVLGIYERLIGSIRSGSSALGSLIKGDIRSFKGHLAEVEWAFLLTLLAGILTAVLTLAHFISIQLKENPIVLAAAFFGLVLGSLFVAYRLLRQPAPVDFVIMVLVAVALFIVLGLGSGQDSVSPTLIAFFGAGALAICAMILPGISGSLILVLIGMYDAVLAAVTDREFSAVGVFILGAIVGLAVFSQVLYIALQKAHDHVLAVLIGLMAGSLRILWPWPEGVDGPTLGAPDVQVPASLLAAVVGFGFVLLIARLARPNAEAV